MFCSACLQIPHLVTPPTNISVSTQTHTARAPQTPSINHDSLSTITTQAKSTPKPTPAASPRMSAFILPSCPSPPHTFLPRHGRPNATPPALPVHTTRAQKRTHRRAHAELFPPRQHRQHRTPPPPRPQSRLWVWVWFGLGYPRAPTGAEEEERESRGAEGGR